jgi:hypothetical protein
LRTDVARVGRLIPPALGLQYDGRATAFESCVERSIDIERYVLIDDAVEVEINWAIWQSSDWKHQASRQLCAIGQALEEPELRGDQSSFSSPG